MAILLIGIPDSPVPEKGIRSTDYSYKPRTILVQNIGYVFM